MKNIFTEEVNQRIKDRISKLTPNISPLWGSMNVAQMLAHCCVTYELIYENKHPKPGAFRKFLLKAFVKKMVVNEVPYTKNGRTAEEFIISDHRDFEKEQKRLLDFIQKTYELGADYFDGKESHAFGNLNKTEWNNMFYKHLDHHLSQFGV